MSILWIILISWAILTIVLLPSMWKQCSPEGWKERTIMILASPFFSVGYLVIKTIRLFQRD